MKKRKKPVGRIKKKTRSTGKNKLVNFTKSIKCPHCKKAIGGYQLVTITWSKK